MSLKTGKILEKANKLQREGKLNEAAADYRRGIELNPNFCWYHHNLGDVLVKMGDLEGAIASYQQAIKLNSNSAWSYYQLGVAFIERGLLNKAADALNRAIELQPNSYQFYESLAIIFAKKGKWHHVITYYKKALEINSKTPRIYQELGEALEKNGEVEEAIACYNKAIKVDPGRSEFYRKLAENLSKQNRFAEAATIFKKALELEKNDYLSWDELGDVLVKLSKPPEAISAFQKALELQPQNRSLYGRLGRIFSELGRWSEAAEIYRRGIEVGLKNHKVYQSLAMAETELGNWSEAVIAWNKALELQPKNHKSYYRLGNALGNLGKWSEAVAAYRQSIKIKPNYGYSYAGLGNALANLGNWSEAVTTYRQAVQLCKADSYQYLRELHKQLASALVQLDPSANEKFYDRIWNKFNSVDSVKDFNPNCPTKFNREAVTGHFMVNSEYKVIHLDSLTDEDRVFLENVNLSPGKLELLKQTVHPKDVYKNFEVEEKLNLTKTGIAVSTGYLYSACPRTDKIVRSDRSLCFNTEVMIYAYRFVGGDGEVFYIFGDGGMRFVRACAYFPRLELVVKLERYDWSGHAKEIQKLINWFKGHVVSDWGLVKSYLSNQQPKGVAIIFGLYVIGHNLWNEYTGVHSLYEAGILDKVEGFLIGPKDFFNIESVYPEIPAEKIKRVPLDKIWETILANNYCVLPVFDIIVREGLARKIYESSRRRSSPAVLQEVEIAKKQFPLLWFNLRVHRRFWVSQIEGIANIVNRLYEDFPNLGVVFDGWSRIKIGDKVVEDKEAEEAIARDNKVVEQILALLKPNIPTYNTIGCMTYESVVWAYNIDVFIGPYSSGLVYVTWIANKPGVVHGNTLAVSGKGEYISLLSSREKAVKLDFISQDDVVDVGNLGMNNSYHCNWEAIYNKVFKIVKRLKK